MIGTIPSVTAVPRPLWSLINCQWMDRTEFAAAIERQILNRDLDFRSRLLIRDGAAGLRAAWPRERFDKWLDNSPVRNDIGSICREDLGRVGFLLMDQRLVKTTKPIVIHRLLRRLSSRDGSLERFILGGAAALVLRGQLERRISHGEFNDTSSPVGWETRVTAYGRFGGLDVSLVDTYDITASKLMSPRTKDRDDLRALVHHLDKQMFASRLQTSCAALLKEPDVRKNAKLNWYILYGEDLPA